MNCSGRRDGNTFELLNYALNKLRILGFDIELLHLVDFNIKPCSNCGYACLYHANCPLEDDLYVLVDRLKRADAIIIGSPVYAGSIPAILKAFLERLNALSFTDFHELLDDKIIAIFIIGSVGNEIALQTIISGLSTKYEGIESIIISTAIIPTGKEYYPSAWRNGGLIRDSYNRMIMDKLVEKLYRIMSSRR